MVVIFFIENFQHADPGLIDMGLQTADDAHNICPDGSDLPIIRSKDMLERIQRYIGNTGQPVDDIQESPGVILI